MKLKEYIKDSYNELIYKVTWPTWEELQSSALIVMITTLILSIVVALMDFSFKIVMKFIYTLF